MKTDDDLIEFELNFVKSSYEMLMNPRPPTDKTIDLAMMFLEGAIRNIEPLHYFNLAQAAALGELVIELGKIPTRKFPAECRPAIHELFQRLFKFMERELEGLLDLNDLPVQGSA